MAISIKTHKGSQKDERRNDVRCGVIVLVRILDTVKDEFVDSFWKHGSNSSAESRPIRGTFNEAGSVLTLTCWL